MTSKTAEIANNVRGGKRQKKKKRSCIVSTKEGKVLQRQCRAGRHRDQVRTRRAGLGGRAGPSEL